MIFDLCLGQRGLLDGRPHHRLRPLIQSAIHQELLEFFGNHAFGVEIHGQVGIVPIARDAEPFELLTLHINPTLGKGPAFLAELDDVDRILVASFFAILLFDLPFDRQTVAVPARDIACVASHHLLAAYNHILQDLVQRVPDMQMPVGIGGAVMQREGLAPLFFAQTVVNPDFGPAFQPFRFTFGQTCAHREIGFWQVQCIFVVRRLGAHDVCPWMLS